MSTATDDGPGTITLCLEATRQGVSDAVARLWDHYRRESERVAYSTLRRGAYSGAREEAEDAALSAFVRLHHGLSQGRFPTLGGRDELGFLLRRIVRRRAFHRLRSASRRKRGGHHMRQALDLDLLPAPGLGPADGIDGEDSTDDLLASLPNDTLRLIVQWRIESYTDGEIAERLGCTRVTIQRKWQCIRTILGSRIPTTKAGPKASIPKRP